MNHIKHFFWFCSGASIAVLKRCPTEQSKYVGIGATILFTAMLSAVSAGYAIYTIFQSMVVSFLFGIFWGCIIFNIDRLIVCSIRKKNNLFDEFKIAIPRLLFAFLLAVIISKPIELKIFEKEINQQIDKRNISASINAKDDLNKVFPEIQSLEHKIDVLKKEINDKELYRNKAQQDYDFERFGKSSAHTTGVPGLGTNAKKKEQQLNEAESALSAITKVNTVKIVQYESDIKKYSVSKDNVFSSQKHNIDLSNGFVSRIKALDELNKQDGLIWLINTFLTLLFIVIEVCPILVKLMSKRGPYDNLIETHEDSFEKYRIERVFQSSQAAYTRIKKPARSSGYKKPYSRRTVRR